MNPQKIKQLKVYTHYLPQYKPHPTNPIITSYCVWAYIGHPLLGQIKGAKTIVETKAQAQKLASKMRKELKDG